MRAFLLRIIYAVIVVVMLLIVIPLFFSVVGFALPGAAWELIRLCIVCLAVLYVLFGPEPPSPFPSAIK